MPLRFCDWTTVSPFFSPQEVMSPDILKNKAAWGMLDYDALLFLNQFRAALGKRLLINHGNLHLRGVRSVAEQIKVQRLYGGAENSQHVAGRAFDISSPDMTLPQLAQACEKFGWSAIGIYPSKNFVHVDRRMLYSHAQVTFLK